MATLNDRSSRSGNRYITINIVIKYLAVSINVFHSTFTKSIVEYAIAIARRISRGD